jgi:hypothetical protein
MDGAVVAANRALASRGYARDEARVESAHDGLYRLTGTMLTTTETGPPTYLLRLVSLIPERKVLAEARTQWDPSA